MATPVLNYISEPEYLEAERKAFEKHEWYKGELYAMSGASIIQQVIFSNIFEELTSKLKGKNCTPYGSDLRILIPSNIMYTNVETIWEYIFVDTTSNAVEKFIRNNDNSWQLTE